MTAEKKCKCMQTSYTQQQGVPTNKCHLLSVRTGFVTHAGVIWEDCLVFNVKYL